MADFVGREYIGAKEVVDGNTYTQCTFKETTLIFRGGPIPIFTMCEWNNCTWGWEDAAGRTFEFLRVMRNTMGENGRILVDDVARQVRTPFPPGTV